MAWKSMHTEKVIKFHGTVLNSNYLFIAFIYVNYFIVVSAYDFIGTWNQFITNQHAMPDAYETIFECQPETEFKLACRQKQREGGWKHGFYYDIKGYHLTAEFDLDVVGNSHIMPGRYQRIIMWENKGDRFAGWSQSGNHFS